MNFRLRWPWDAYKEESRRKARMVELSTKIEKVYKSELGLLGPEATQQERDAAYSVASAQTEQEDNERRMLDEEPLRRKAALWKVPITDDLLEDYFARTFYRVLSQEGERTLIARIKAEKERKIEWWGKLILPGLAVLLSLSTLIYGPIQTANNYQRDSRAWIELDPIKLLQIGGPLESSEPEPLMEGHQQRFSIDIVPRNIGKTEARNVQYRFFTTQGTPFLGSSKDDVEEAVANHSNGRTRDGKKPYPDALLTSAPQLAPNATGLLNYPTTMDAPYFFRTIPNPTYAQSYALGRIEYDDVFGKHHWMTYCFTLESYKRMSYCKYGNDEDQKR